LSAPERGLAFGVRAVLYLIILGFPVSGYLLNVSQGGGVDLYGWTVPGLFGAEAGSTQFFVGVHDVALPLAFYAAVFAHVGAAAKHHFFDRRPQDIRRMIT
jgi:cytochrome b561